MKKFASGNGNEPGERGANEDDLALKLYLKEIGDEKLLTPQDEIDLARLIKKGDKNARERMIKANLRLVVKIANDYAHYGVPLLDLINEGNIGLMKAVDRFDPTKGAKFSTYGAFWIKQAIKRALANQAKTIRLPVHLIAKISHMRRKSMELQEELGREPTDEELADELGITETKVSRMRIAAIRPASLDGPIGEEESGNLAEIIADENSETGLEQMEGKALTAMVGEMIKALSPREHHILQQRFGLDGGTSKTLDQVAEGLGVSRERIRQIQNNALNKLRRMIQQYEAVSPEMSEAQPRY